MAASAVACGKSCSSTMPLPCVFNFVITDCLTCSGLRILKSKESKSAEKMPMFRLPRYSISSCGCRSAGKRKYGAVGAPTAQRTALMPFSISSLGSYSTASVFPLTLHLPAMAGAFAGAAAGGFDERFFEDFGIGILHSGLHEQDPVDHRPAVPPNRPVRVSPKGWDLESPRSTSPKRVGSTQAQNSLLPR